MSKASKELLTLDISGKPNMNPLGYESILEPYEFQTITGEILIDYSHKAYLESKEKMEEQCLKI